MGKRHRKSQRRPAAVLLVPGVEGWEAPLVEWPPRVAVPRNRIESELWALFTRLERNPGAAYVANPLTQALLRAGWLRRSALNQVHPGERDVVGQVRELLGLDPNR